MATTHKPRSTATRAARTTGTHPPSRKSTKRPKKPTSRRPTSLSDINPHDTGDRKLFHVVVETPKGSSNKLGYDPKLQAFKLDSIMPQGMAFPFDFGFVPGTIAPDGDPVDVLLLMESPVAPGTVVSARLVGVIEAVQTEKDGTSSENDRIVAVAPASPLYENIVHLSDIPKEVLDQIEHFFVTYNAEHGKEFKLKGMHGPKRATKCFEKARKRYKRQ